MNLIKIVTVGTATILSETKKNIKTLIKEGFNNAANRKVDTAQMENPSV